MDFILSFQRLHHSMIMSSLTPGLKTNAFVVGIIRFIRFKLCNEFTSSWFHSSKVGSSVTRPNFTECTQGCILTAEIFIIFLNSGYSDCRDALTQGQTTSGVYTIQPDSQPAFQADCDMDTDGGGWTVFQRRQDGSVDFYLDWSDYQQGFGDLSGEFWLGLDKIHRLTSTATQLRVDMQDFQLNSQYAKYTHFSVGDSVSNYTLSVSGYSGTAGNSLGSRHNGSRFSTRDQDNDNDSGVNCAQRWGGAWWFHSCYTSNLNGHYQNSSGAYIYGVAWNYFTHYLKFSEMKVRRN